MTDFSDNILRDESASSRDDGRNTSNVATVAVTFPVREDLAETAPVEDGTPVSKDGPKNDNVKAEARPAPEKADKAASAELPQKDMRDEQAASEQQRPDAPADAARDAAAEQIADPVASEDAAEAGGASSNRDAANEDSAVFELGDDFQIPEPREFVETYNAREVSGEVGEAGIIYLFEIGDYDFNNFDPSLAIGSAVVGSDFHWSITEFRGYPNGLPEDRQFDVVGQDSAGNLPNPDNPNHFIPRITIDATPPDIEVLTSLTYELTFESEPGSDIELRDANGQVLAIGKVGDDGLFRFDLSKNPVEVGTKFQVVTRDEAGNFAEQSFVAEEPPLNYRPPQEYGTRRVKVGQRWEKWKFGRLFAHGRVGFLWNDFWLPLKGFKKVDQYENRKVALPRPPAEHRPEPYEGENQEAVLLDDNGNPINPPFPPAVASSDELDIMAALGTETESLLEEAPTDLGDTSADEEELLLDDQQDEELEIADEQVENTVEEDAELVAAENGEAVSGEGEETANGEEQVAASEDVVEGEQTAADDAAETPVEAEAEETAEVEDNDDDNVVTVEVTFPHSDPFMDSQNNNLGA